MQLQERWPEAADRYASILKIDSTVLAASKGLDESRARAELDDRIRGAIGAPDRLSDDKVWQATQSLLEYGRNISPAGAVLTGQLNELDRLLQRARAPPVVVRSERLYLAGWWRLLFLYLYLCRYFLR